jgi:hypothetical protein
MPQTTYTEFEMPFCEWLLQMLGRAIDSIRDYSETSSVEYYRYTSGLFPEQVQDSVPIIVHEVVKLCVSG